MHELSKHLFLIISKHPYRYACLNLYIYLVFRLIVNTAPHSWALCLEIKNVKLDEHVYLTGFVVATKQETHLEFKNLIAILIFN